MIRMDDNTMSLHREIDVVHITAGPSQEPPIFDARQGLAKFRIVHRNGAARRLGELKARAFHEGSIRECPAGAV
jgi:hypothetical protein